MEKNTFILLGLGALMMTITGCCCAASDFADGGYGDGGYYDSGSGSAEGDLFASEAGSYEGSDCWASAGCAGVEDGTYSYEDYSSGSYEYYEQ